MAAEKVRCFICHKERGSALCGKIKGPSGAPEYLCPACLEKMPAKTLNDIRVE